MMKLVIDSDYFVMSNTLDEVWGSENDLMINCQYRMFQNERGNISYIDDFSIPMYWVTVFYFKKSDILKICFTLYHILKKISDTIIFI